MSHHKKSLAILFFMVFITVVALIVALIGLSFTINKSKTEEYRECLLTY